MLQRLRKQSAVFEYNSENDALKFRNQAEGMPLGVRRDELLRWADRIDDASAIKERAETTFQLPPR